MFKKPVSRPVDPALEPELVLDTPDGPPPGGVEVSPGEVLGDGDFVIDDFERTNGLSDSDARSDSIAEFTCVKRERVKNGFWYYVEHSNVHDNLDYEGNTVIINDAERLCSDFEINDDGTLALFVEDVEDAGT